MRGKTVNSETTPNTSSNNKSRNRRVLAAAGLVAGIALVAAGGFSAVVKDIDLGKYSAGSWQKPSTIPDSVKVTPTPGSFENLTPGAAGKKAAKLEIENKDKDHEYAINLDKAKEQWADLLKSGDGPASANAKKAFKSKLVLLDVKDGKKAAKTDKDGNYIIGKAKDQTHPTTTTLSINLSLAPLDGASNADADSLGFLQNTKIDKVTTKLDGLIGPAVAKTS